MQKRGCERDTATQRYPAFVCQISCPPSLYDVTLRADKTAVEFSDWTPVLAAVRAAAAQAWHQHMPAALLLDPGLPSAVADHYEAAAVSSRAARQSLAAHMSAAPKHAALAYGNPVSTQDPLSSLRNVSCLGTAELDADEKGVFAFHDLSAAGSEPWDAEVDPSSGGTKRVRFALEVDSRSSRQCGRSWCAKEHAMSPTPGLESAWQADVQSTQNKGSSSRADTHANEQLWGSPTRWPGYTRMPGTGAWEQMSLLEADPGGVQTAAPSSYSPGNVDGLDPWRLQAVISAAASPLKHGSRNELRSASNPSTKRDAGRRQIPLSVSHSEGTKQRHGRDGFRVRRRPAMATAQLKPQQLQEPPSQGLAASGHALQSSLDKGPCGDYQIAEGTAMLRSARVSAASLHGRRASAAEEDMTWLGEQCWPAEPLTGSRGRIQDASGTAAAPPKVQQSYKAAEEPGKAQQCTDHEMLLEACKENQQPRPAGIRRAISAPPQPRPRMRTAHTNPLSSLHTSGEITSRDVPGLATHASSQSRSDLLGASRSEVQNKDGLARRRLQTVSGACSHLSRSKLPEAPASSTIEEQHNAEAQHSSPSWAAGASTRADLIIKNSCSGHSSKGAEEPCLQKPSADAYFTSKDDRSALLAVPARRSRAKRKAASQNLPGSMPGSLGAIYDQVLKHSQDQDDALEVRCLNVYP